MDNFRSKPPTFVNSTLASVLLKAISHTSSPQPQVKETDFVFSQMVAFIQMCVRATICGSRSYSLCPFKFHKSTKKIKQFLTEKDLNAAHVLMTRQKFSLF